MALIDFELDKLRSYAPELPEESDFDSFWTDTLTDARTFDLAAEFTKIDNKLKVIDTYDVTFNGFGGTPVKAWLHVPAGTAGPLPTVVQYHGYSGGRGFPHATTLFAQAGYAHVVMDTRGQGWSAGGHSSTVDASADAGINHIPGFMTSGLQDPKAYYYRRVYVDAVRLLDAVVDHPLVDRTKIIVTGGSQGGGITLAVAGLAPSAGLDLVGAAPDVPFLCNFPRALEISDRNPYAEITAYLASWRDQVDVAYRTLSYFDGVNLGKRAQAPALFSVALMDPICPPSTVFSAYNHYAGSEKSINVYSHNEHEGGGPYQLDAQLDWFAERFAG
ncbi:acetylxylan esterase [Microlunatus panaciterrae]|uniref:Cephalosporin-C deacetylase n=1 Tax=Microlunatus panaciterrae TaxID=400768 RepID=A0ABS2RHH4_9ACTN|nr:alpha/beta fold hydrolase [Microlunatus panaciterrae]MBM7798461.1 cephalosporin-C deacetylase [Microlunatus panaciterrae]